MQRRVLAAAIALICVNTAAAHAQTMPLADQPSWGPKFRVTPFAGYLPSVKRHETWIHNSNSTNTFIDTEYHLASGNSVGVTGEYSFNSPWSALVGLMYGSRGDSEFDLTSTGEQFSINGSRYLFARAGASLALTEKNTELTLRHLSASVFAAPFYMREMPRSQIGFENLAVFDPSHAFGLNLGVNGEYPFAKDKLSLQAGIEDYATWFSSDALSRLPDSFFNDATPGASTRVQTKVSNMWLLRAGLSYRWR